MGMYKFKHNNRELRKSLYTDEETPFKDWEARFSTIKKEPEPKRFELPKPRIQKRKDIRKDDLVFYLTWLVLAIVSVIWNVVIAQFGLTVSSLVAVILIVMAGFFTEPSVWSHPKHALSFWNASVTARVLLKSIHPGLYRFRNILMWAAFAGIAFGLMLDRELAAFCWGLFLIAGMLALAAQDLSLYGRMANGLAWFSFLLGCMGLIIHGSLYLVTVFLSITLHQMYERLRDLQIEYPEWLEEEG